VIRPMKRRNLFAPIAKHVARFLPACPIYAIILKIPVISDINVLSVVIWRAFHSLTRWNGSRCAITA